MHKATVIAKGKNMVPTDGKAYSGNRQRLFVPVVGFHGGEDALPDGASNMRMLLDYWRSLLNPDLCQLPPRLLAKQLEEVQVALRDAIYHLTHC